MLLGAGLGMGLYGKFVRKYNNLWLLGSVLPAACYSLFHGNRNQDRVDNAYRYLIAKRAATCEYEANEARFMANEWT